MRIRRPRRPFCANRSRVLLCAALLATLVGGAASAFGEDTPLPADVEAARALTSEGAHAFAAGKADEARQKFAAALGRLPGNEVGRKNLALAHARLAAEALRKEDGGVALGHLDEALALHPGRIRYRVDRGEALRLLGRLGESLREADDLTTRAPGFLDGWLLLADVQEARGQLAEAVTALERALQVVVPRDRPVLMRRYGALVKRANTEATFLTHATGNFIAKYGPDADPGTVRLALTLLEDAYSRVTADLRVAPRTAARVVLYEGGEFQDVTGAHGWIGALYVNGTLRVPIRNLERHRDTAERILSHEFTHHVLRQSTPGLPTWWHEGIAQHEETKTAAKERQFAVLQTQMARLRDRDALISLDRLRGTHVARVSDVNFVTLYYAEARSFVDWLVEENGDGALPAFLTALGTGRDTSAACKRVFGATEDELFRRWKLSL